MTPHPTILITGADGQVGWELIRALGPLGEVTATHHTELDLASPDSISAYVRVVRPSLIVNAASYTAVERAETERDLAYAVNATGPEILAREAYALGAWLIHYSTDYIFDGHLSAPYTETDEPCPLNFYGTSKLAGDLAVAQSGCLYLLLRVSWIYGLRGRNLLRTVLRHSGELRMKNDVFACPTWSRWIADATAAVAARLLREGRNGASLAGVYHMAGGGRCTPWDFGDAVLTAWPRPKITLLPTTLAAAPSPIQRPRNTSLDCSKLRRAFGVELPNWRRGIEQAVADHKAMLEFP